MTVGIGEWEGSHHNTSNNNARLNHIKALADVGSSCIWRPWGKWKLKLTISKNNHHKPMDLSLSSWFWKIALQMIVLFQQLCQKVQISFVTSHFLSKRKLFKAISSLILGQALSFLHLSFIWPSSSGVSKVKWELTHLKNDYFHRNVLLQAEYRHYCDYPKCGRIAPPWDSFKKCLKCKDLKIRGIWRYCGSRCQGD